MLFFHLDIALFKGGFVGVDVFFVLSGYFIARTLLADGEAIGRAQIIAFYNRRIRRILPLALFVCFVVLALGAFVLPTVELKELTRQTLAAATGWPNLLFMQDDSYFEATLFRPMLHYWSLGVEYQYYAIFPFLFLLVQRGRFLGPAVLFGTFALCVFMTYSSREEAFFLMPTRIWEFMLGYYALRLEGRLPKHSGTISAVAVAAILLCAVLYDRYLAFPGFYAAIPAIATFFIIMCGFPEAKGAWKAPSALLVWIGTLSFSIYLWHFPVIWAATYKPFIYDGIPTAFEIVAVCVVTLLLSVLSYRFVEGPCRNRKLIPDGKFYAGIAVLFAALFALAFFYHQANYKVRSFNENQTKATQAVENRMPYRCKVSEKKKGKLLSCALGAEHENAKKRVLLAGNSHADSLKPAFIEELEGRNINLYMMRESVNPGQNGTKPEKFIAAINERKATDFVFHGLIHDEYNFGEMEKLLAAVLEMGVRVHIIDPVPYFPASVPMFVYTGQTGTLLTRQDYDTKNKIYLDWKRHMQKAYPAIRFYQSAKVLCPSECMIFNDGQVMYNDRHHLSIAGADIMRPIIRQIYGGK